MLDADGLSTNNDAIVVLVHIILLGITNYLI